MPCNPESEPPTLLSLDVVPPGLDVIPPLALELAPPEVDAPLLVEPDAPGAEGEEDTPGEVLGAALPLLTDPEPMPPLVELDAPGDEPELLSRGELVLGELVLGELVPGEVVLEPVDGMLDVPPGDADGLAMRACASRLHASKSAVVGVAAWTGPDTANRPAAVMVAIA